MSSPSIVSNVDTALVLSTVNPPGSAVNEGMDLIELDNTPKSAHKPTSTNTHCLPSLPREREDRMIPPTTYTQEYTMKGVWLIARRRPSGPSLVSEALDAKTTVTAPITAMRMPKRSRYYSIRNLRFGGNGVINLSESFA